MQHILPQLCSPHGHLRARAVWVCAQYRRVQWRVPGHHHSVVTGTVALMRDPELPVRVQAGVCMTAWVRHRPVGQPHSLRPNAAAKNRSTSYV